LLSIPFKARFFSLICFSPFYRLKQKLKIEERAGEKEGIKELKLLTLRRGYSNRQEGKKGSK
jgi:hypothetical protein